MSDHKKQPYDATLKALFSEQTAEMLPYILPGAQFLGELNSEVLKPQPPLRTDKVYLILYRGEIHILHIELETKGRSSMVYRMLSYYGLLLEKHRKPIISVIIYPFETTIVESPLEVTSGREIQLLFRYKSIALWKDYAQPYIDQHAVSMYPLLPTMQGANASLLVQAIDELKMHHGGTELSHRLLWLRTLLGRVKSIPDDDKKLVVKEIDMFDELLDEDPYLLERDALVARRAAQEAELRTLQRTMLDLIQFKFPSLAEFAQSKVAQITKPETLRVLTVQISNASDENAVRTLLNFIAA